MNKNDIVKDVQTQTGLSKANANEVVTAVVDSIIDGIQGEKTVKLQGLGAFSVTQKKARKGRNPRTGESINIPAKKNVKFKPSSVLKSTLENM